MFPSLSVAAAPIHRLVASGLKFTLLYTWGGLAPGLRISTTWTPAKAPPVGPILSVKTRVSRLAPRFRYARRYMDRKERESSFRVVPGCGTHIPPPSPQDPITLLSNGMADRKSTRLNSSHLVISYAV